MTKRVLKYIVPVDDQWHNYHLPEGSVPVYVECKDDNVCMWVEVPDETVDGHKHEWEYKIFGTNHPVPDEADYVGTAFDSSVMILTLVWHVYKKRVT